MRTSNPGKRHRQNAAADARHSRDAACSGKTLARATEQRRLQRTLGPRLDAVDHLVCRHRILTALVAQQYLRVTERSRVIIRRPFVQIIVTRTKKTHSMPLNVSGR